MNDRLNSENETNHGENKNMITLEDTEHFDREGFSGDIYVDKKESKGFTALRVVVNGKHPRKEIKYGTTRTYFVVSGEGIFTIDGETKKVSEGDFLIIEQGHQYEYEGKMILFETNISPTNIFKDELVNILSIKTK